MNPTHVCEQVPQIISMEKDIENIKENVNSVKSKQDKLEEYVIEARELLTEQRKTNEYMGKMLDQNQKFMEKIDSKYEKDVNETKEKIHTLELAMIKENVNQDNTYNKDKVTAMLKALGWTLGVIGTLVGIIWKLILPMLG